jgi:hypothetical protein
VKQRRKDEEFVGIYPGLNDDIPYDPNDFVPINLTKSIPIPEHFI